MRSLKQILCEFSNKILQQNKMQAFFVGTMIGLIASWIYVLAGGDTFLFVPLWAEIAFYPGFHVGWYCYDLFGRNEPLALLIGSLSVGLFYGIVLVTILSLWGLLVHRKKYAIVLLCIATVVIGMFFLKKLFLSSDSITISSIRQEFTLSITSDPPGAKIYPLWEHWNELPNPIGTTPLELKGSYSIDRDGSGWGVSGRGIRLKSTEEGFLVLLDCVIAKNGYICKEVAPVLATIPPNIRPGQMPSELEYNAKLISEESPHVKKVGTAIIANGSFLEVNPPSIKLTEGVYIIDIKSAE